MRYSSGNQRFRPPRVDPEDFWRKVVRYGLRFLLYVVFILLAAIIALAILVVILEDPQLNKIFLAFVQAVGFVIGSIVAFITVLARNPCLWLLLILALLAGWFLGRRRGEL